jgi:hypothetical protein
MRRLEQVPGAAELVATRVLSVELAVVGLTVVDAIESELTGTLEVLEVAGWFVVGSALLDAPLAEHTSCV